MRLNQGEAGLHLAHSLALQDLADYFNIGR
jgi:hypothetical protein